MTPARCCCSAWPPEIGGAWLFWQGWREHRGLWWIAAGVIALGAYGFVACLQPDPDFGLILAAYGGVFVAGSLAWGMVVDRFRPDRWDLTGAVICLIGVAVIMYAPRNVDGSRPSRNGPARPRAGHADRHQDRLCPRVDRRAEPGPADRRATRGRLPADVLTPGHVGVAWIVAAHPRRPL